MAKWMMFYATLLNYCYCGAISGISFKRLGFESFLYKILDCVSTAQVTVATQLHKWFLFLLNRKHNNNTQENINTKEQAQKNYLTRTIK